MEMTAKDDFWNKIAEKYSKKPVPNETVYQQKLTMSQAYFSKEMSVLEFGCGTGSTALVHASFVQNYLATDIASEMLAIANQKLAQTKIDNLQFEQSTLEQLSCPNEHFDAILAMSILHLVDDTKQSIQRVYDLLAPNGVFISSTPCITGLWRGLKLVLPICTYFNLLPNVHFFLHDQLIADMEAVGFKIETHWIPEANKMTSFIIARKVA
jgi:ubiquinone/menaquinone biosynthesis C-methylase UbiE